MDINRRSRNCYSYGGFGYLAKNCRNIRIGGRIRDSRRLKYRRNEQRTEKNRPSNLNGDENKIVLDYVLKVVIDLQCSLE